MAIKPIQTLQVIFPAGTAGITRELQGPINFFHYLGNDFGLPIDISFDNSTWDRFQPGQKLDGLKNVTTLWLRNPHPQAAVFFIRYGTATFSQEDAVIRSRDGRHPATVAIQCPAVCAAGILAGSATDATENEWTRWIPHVKDIVAHNHGAAAVYLRLRWSARTVVPVAGVTAPHVTLAIPAHGDLILPTTHGFSFGQDFPVTVRGMNLWSWVSNTDALLANDNPAGGGDQLTGILTVT